MVGIIRADKWMTLFKENKREARKNKKGCCP